MNFDYFKIRAFLLGLPLSEFFRGQLFPMDTDPFDVWAFFVCPFWTVLGCLTEYLVLVVPRLGSHHH